MRIVGRFFRRSPVGVDYEPLNIEHGMYAQFKVLGHDVEAASRSYHAASNQWMFGLGIYRNLRLDAHHLVRLINYDTGTIMDRTRNGGRNFVYRAAVRWNLGEVLGAVDPVVGGAGRPEGFSDTYLINVLASDFDAWWKKTKEMSDK